MYLSPCRDDRRIRAGFFFGFPVVQIHVHSRLVLLLARQLCRDEPKTILSPEVIVGLPDPTSNSYANDAVCDGVHQPYHSEHQSTAYVRLVLRETGKIDGQVWKLKTAGW